mgnify:CR=1 FL=1
MTKQTEALKLALEALEHLKHNAEKSGANMGLALVVAEEAITTLRTAIEAAEKQEPVAVYGYCPFCGGEGVARERHPFGNDRCVNRHKYKSSDALTTPPAGDKK